MTWAGQLERPEEALVRYVDENNWEWRTVAKVINRNYHCDYTIPQLKELYEAIKSYGAGEPLLNMTET